MATRRTTSNKRERERSKQAKATAKRERRQDKSPDDDAGTGPEFDENSATTDQLIERIAAGESEGASRTGSFAWTARSGSD